MTTTQAAHKKGLKTVGILLYRDKEPEERRTNDVRRLTALATDLSKLAGLACNTRLAELAEAVSNLAIYAGRCTSHEELERVLLRRMRIEQLINVEQQRGIEAAKRGGK